MKPQKQLIVSENNGDCFRACVASILDLKNNIILPNKHGIDWFSSWCNFLKKYGLRISYGTNCWKDGYWIASVPSLNYPKPLSHAIIMRGTKVYFDPSTKKKYKRGKDMLSEGIIKSGFWIEIDDISKIDKLKILRSKINGN